LEGKGQLTYELHFNDDDFIFEWQFQKTYLNVKESVLEKYLEEKIQLIYDDSFMLQGINFKQA
jgi:hypothetical protein